ncbi:MAG TPA: hypothetical protein ENK83_03250 [Aliiroseovarius sp.]|nr:hypothetical protein [Aliiroseovarius sp.]
MKWIFAFMLALIAGGAAAQEVSDCDWRASARNIGEPWEQNTRTFSNGKTRLALLDTPEPAAGAFHILILSPPYDELGVRQCKVVSASAGIGFYGLDFTGLQAQYDPAIGLGFAIPGQSYVPETDGSAAMYLLITLNQATGQITARVQPTGG